MARQVFALLFAAVGAGSYMDKRQVEGVVHLEVFVGVEHAAQILQQACHASLVLVVLNSRTNRTTFFYLFIYF